MGRGAAARDHGDRGDEDGEDGENLHAPTLRPDTCQRASCILQKMRASRLLSILMLLQTRGRMSARELASEVEVSIRTIYRDVDHLSAAGVPVVVTRGVSGGFKLLDGWRTRLTGLTEAEAQAMFVCGMPGPALELGLGEALVSARRKLLAALPADWQGDAERVSSRFHLDPVAWYRQAARTELLPALAGAVWTARRVEIRYESWKGVAVQTIEPLGLVLKGGAWYLVARPGDPRRAPDRARSLASPERAACTYRVRGMSALTVKEPFERPRDFDLAAYWEESTRRFETEIYRGTAMLRASPLGRKRLRAWSAAVAEAVDRVDRVDRAGAPAAGWVRVTIPIESIEHATAEVLRLGPEAEVLHPPALRERVARTVREMASLYPDWTGLVPTARDEGGAARGGNDLHLGNGHY
jgi:predicted DNA-binding transcriptional regulator YafY